MIPRGIRNNNPGNIRKSSISWLGKVDGVDEAFETFKDMVHGIRALIIVLRTYYTKYKLTTMNKILSRYAPANENDTKAYVNAVSKKTGLKPDEVIIWNKTTIVKLIKAICSVENAGYPIDDEDFDGAWGMLYEVP